MGHSGEAGVSEAILDKEADLLPLLQLLAGTLPRISLGRLDEHHEEMRGHTWVAENSAISKATGMIEG